MVQEVQQQGNWYQTPNEIQGIWDIRRRVREHTQVTPSFSYECSASGNTPTTSVTAYTTTTVSWTINSITSSYGNTVFRIIDGWLQIPLAWAYSVELNGNWWTQYVYYTHTLMVDNKDLLSIKNTASWWVSITQVLNLGKGNILKYKATIENTTAGGWNFTPQMTMTIRKL